MKTLQRVLPWLIINAVACYCIWLFIQARVELGETYSYFEAIGLVVALNAAFLVLNSSSRYLWVYKVFAWGISLTMLCFGIALLWLLRNVPEAKTPLLSHWVVVIAMIRSMRERYEELAAHKKTLQMLNA